MKDTVVQFLLDCKCTVDGGVGCRQEKRTVLKCVKAQTVRCDECTGGANKGGDVESDGDNQGYLRKLLPVILKKTMIEQLASMKGKRKGMQ